MAKSKKKKATRVKFSTKRKTQAKPQRAPVEPGVTTPRKTPVVVPYPKAGRRVKEFEEKLQDEIKQAESQPEPGPKRGPGRPRKEPPPAPPPALEKDIIANAVKVPFDLWSVSQDIPQLKLADSEVDALAEPVKQLLDHYAPQLPVVTVAWFSLAVTAYSIMSIRLRMIAAKKKQNKDSRTEPPSAKDQSQGGPTAVILNGPNSNQRFPDADQIKPEKIE